MPSRRPIAAGLVFLMWLTVHSVASYFDQVPNRCNLSSQRKQLRDQVEPAPVQSGLVQGGHWRGPGGRRLSGKQKSKTVRCTKNKCFFGEEIDELIVLSTYA